MLFFYCYILLGDTFKLLYMLGTYVADFSTVYLKPFCKAYFWAYL